MARRLREARLAVNLRQRDLAFEGCSVGYISRIEKGDRVPSLQVIRELAGRLGVSEEWLARGEDVPEHTDPLADAEFAVRFGELEEARSLIAALLTSNPRPDVSARAEAILGQAAFVEDHATEAIERFERAIDLDASLKEDVATAETLGRAYARVGEIELAVSLFRRHLERARNLGDPLDELRFAVLLANALIDTSALAEATQVLAEIVSQEDDLDQLSLAKVYWTQSRLHAMKREPESARRFARRAIEILDTTESLLYRARAYQLLAFVELDSGNPEEALKLIRLARELAKGSGTTLDEAKFAMEEARALVALGEYEEAAALAMRAGQGFDDAHPWDVGRSYGELASAFEQAGESARAIEMYELAIEVLEPTPNRYLADAYTNYATLLEREGRITEAFDAYKKAAHLSRELERLATSR